MFKRRIALVHAPFSGGAGIPGCELAPSALRMAGLSPRLRNTGSVVHEVRPDLSACGPVGKADLQEVATACHRVSSAIAETLMNNELPILLGGDHSLSIGSIAAVSNQCRNRRQPLWILWFDAHADFNTPSTSPTGNVHGMPAAVICGDGAPELLSLARECPMVPPEHLHLMGVRTMDAGEEARVRESSVNLHTMDEVHRKGLPSLVDSVLEQVASGNGHLHVSFDVDAMDPTVAPGVGTPETNGIGAAEMRQCLQKIEASGLLGSLDVMEFNPLHDTHGVTARLVVDLLENVLGEPAAVSSAGVL